MQSTRHWNNRKGVHTHAKASMWTEDVTVLWDQEVYTDSKIMAIRADIIIKNRKEKTCILIDMAIPADRNVIQKEAEKKLKYKSLCIEIQQMWNMKYVIIPAVTGATGIVSKGSKKNLEATPGRHATDSLQKTAILGTSHIMRKVLQSGTWSLSGGDYRWFKRRSARKKRLVTMMMTTATTTSSKI